MDIALTTTQAIRAVLGVAEEGDELNDQVFIDFGIEDEIILNLDLWLQSEANSTFAAVEGGTNDTAFSALTLCTKYLGALLILPSLATATAKKLSDGQDEFQRQDRDIPAIRHDLERQLQRYQAYVLNALSVTPTSTFTLMGRSSPATDPIRGT
jgi:hypothetical protein